MESEVEPQGRSRAGLQFVGCNEPRKLHHPRRGQGAIHIRSLHPTQLRERHEASDFDTKTQDKVEG